MVTGHASTQAPQVTQSHTASYGMAASTTGRARAAARAAPSPPGPAAGMPGASEGRIHGTRRRPGTRGTPASASMAIWRSPITNVLGLSGLPVAQAGHCDWHRPHSVQVKASSRSFQPRSTTARTPNVPVSASRSMDGSSPRGRSFRKAVLKKAVAMWRCLEPGRYARKAETRRMLAHHATAKTASCAAGASGLAISCPRGRETISAGAYGSP